MLHRVDRLTGQLFHTLTLSLRGDVMLPDYRFEEELRTEGALISFHVS